MAKYVYGLMGAGAVLLFLGWFLPGIIERGATGVEEHEQALRQASVELLHPDLVEGDSASGQADQGPAQQLLAQQQAAAARATSRGGWTRAVLLTLGIVCLGAAVVGYYADQES